MVRSFTLLLATLIATAAAAPTSMNPQGEALNKLEARGSENDCGASSFENQTSGGSPLVSDCKKMIANIAGGGSWRTTLDIQRQLVSYGSCKFGVQCYGTSGSSGSFYVGNSDIIDVVNSAISQFQSGGRVGAKGKMSCTAGGNDDHGDVYWGIY